MYTCYKNIRYKGIDLNGIMFKKVSYLIADRSGNVYFIYIYSIHVHIVRDGSVCTIYCDSYLYQLANVLVWQLEVFGDVKV